MPETDSRAWYDEASRPRGFRAWLRCLFGKHHIPEKACFETMGAIFHGGLCRRCYRVKDGQLICNAWDDAQTVTENGVHRLRGKNPMIESGGYVVVGSYEALLEMSLRLREMRLGKKR